VRNGLDAERSGESSGADRGEAVSGGMGPALELKEVVRERRSYYRIRRTRAKMVEQSIPG